MVVSSCCRGEVYRGQRREFPLGGSTWYETLIVEMCEICGKECDSVEALEDGDEDAHHHETN